MLVFALVVVFASSIAPHWRECLELASWLNDLAMKCMGPMPVPVRASVRYRLPEPVTVVQMPDEPVAVKAITPAVQAVAKPSFLAADAVEVIGELINDGMSPGKAIKSAGYIGRKYSPVKAYLASEYPELFE